MASLYKIRRRIDNLKNANQILLAMKSLGTSNFIKAQKLHRKSQDYFASNRKAIYHLLYALYKEVPVQTTQLISNMFVLPASVTKLIVILGADYAFCGSYNQDVIDAAKKFIDETTQAGQDFKLMVLGARTWEYFHKRYPKQTLDFKLNLRIKEFNGALLHLLVTTIEKEFITFKVNAVAIIYTQFSNMLSTQVKVVPLFPVDYNHMPLTDEPGSGVIYLQQANLVTDPAISSLSENLINDYLFFWIYTALVEAMVSFYAAKMMSAEGALNNAEVTLGKAERDYSKQRQARITNDLLEISSYDS